ncbi:MAG: NAD-glutamate dehydrogenase domain-containing protein [Waddliaceae bacterium]
MKKERRLTESQLNVAIQQESEKFKEYYAWIEQAMPDLFFEEVKLENIMLITHSLMGFNLQDYFTTINMRTSAIVMCLDSADADLRILKGYAMYGIKNYRAYISKSPPPFPGVSAKLRVAQIFFTEAIESAKEPLPQELTKELRALVKERNPKVTDEEFDKLISGMNSRFLRSLPIDRLILALDMFFRAKTRDNCQYVTRYNEDWEEKKTPSLQLVLAWRNTPKHNFLYRIVRVIHRHGLVMQRVNATYINPYSPGNILIMALGLHGSDGQAVWDVANIPEFLRELATVKYFASFDLIDQKLVKTKIISDVMGNLVRAMINFVHQSLVYLDPHLYTTEHIEEDLCRHPALISKICESFAFRFDPQRHDVEKFESLFKESLEEINLLDTGHPFNDQRRKNVLKQALHMVKYTLKTNLYRTNYTALSFRLDPEYLDLLPFDRTLKFPEMPYGIFFFKGMHFFGFHIRFKDLSRGGLRTVYPSIVEHIETEQNSVFRECYNLAYTQHKKNKDIPEGGAKGVIFLKPWDRLESEATILEKELTESHVDPVEIKHKMDDFYKQQRKEFLYQAQRSYIESFITIINCDLDGKIRAKYIVDYLKKPEYIYLGPDENMHDDMIEWIARFSLKYDYKPGSSFISGKPKLGINHKEYGVTSLGVNVYMEKVLNYLGIDPEKETFTVKISGGPDGDVAGNQILNLNRYYPNTAKLLALTDISGTIYDPEGLDLGALEELFHQQRPIKYYPPEKLHNEGFLLDREAKRKKTAYAQETLCMRMKEGKLIEDWVSGSEMNHLFRQNVHRTPVDVFIPAGGRPRTLNQHNVHLDYLDATGKPTSKAIVEGANLYLNDEARHFLEGKGVLIIKDSSANKAGVICSSYEVLTGLILGEELFIREKEKIVPQVLKRLRKAASDEADLLLLTHKETGKRLTDISDEISRKINKYTDQILDYLEEIELNDDLTQVYIDYCLPIVGEEFKDRIIKYVPENHKKAIIASSISSQLVYKNGLDWEPSIVDVLPTLLFES